MNCTGSLFNSLVAQLRHSKLVRNLGITVLIFALCLTFCGCKNRNSIKSKGYSAPYSVVYHSVPFAYGDEIWDEAELIETDQYGRELYSYIAVPEFDSAASDYSDTFCYIYALVVCQKADKNRVYYYEDQCYLLRRTEAYSDEDLAAIKNANDWGKPLDESKITSVANSFDHAVSADADACLESFSDAVIIDEQYSLIFDEITVINNERLCAIREYYIVSHSKGNKDYFFGLSYIALFDKDNNLIRYTSFDGTFEKFPAEIMAFKITTQDESAS